MTVGFLPFRQTVFPDRPCDPRRQDAPEPSRPWFHDEQVLARVLAVTGSVLTALAVALIVVLALLPHGESVQEKTISVNVYGPYGDLVRAILLIFGIGALAVAASLVMRLHGRAGRVCGALCGVWATAALVDAFVSTSPPHTRTVEGTVHIGLALLGLAAQVLLAAAYPVLLRRRVRKVSLVAAGTTLLVIGAGVFFAVHQDSLAGLGERFLFAASALWMVVNVHLADLSGVTPQTSTGPAPVPVRR